MRITFGNQIAEKETTAGNILKKPTQNKIQQMTVNQTVCKINQFYKKSKCLKNLFFKETTIAGRILDF